MSPSAFADFRQGIAIPRPGVRMEHAVVRGATVADNAVIEPFTIVE